MKDGKAETVTDDADVMNNRILSVIALGESIFMGTDGDGLYEVRDRKVVRHYCREEGNLSSNVVMKLHEGVKKEGIWGVTGSRLFWISNSGTYMEISGFPSNNNLDLLILSDGTVLIPSGAGIYQTTEEALFSGEELKPRLYRSDDGVPFELTANSNQCIDGNQVFLCGSGGILSYRPSEAASAKGDASLLFHMVEFDDTRVWLDESAPCVIPANVMRVDFDVHLLTYRVENPLLFYYLEGFDETPRKEYLRDGVNISYTNLEGGEYSLHFGIMDQDTGDILQESELPVFKEYKWYESAWGQFLQVMAFLAIAVVMAVTIAALINRRFKERLKREYEESEKRHLRELAYKDYLTGVHNRNYLEAWMEKHDEAPAFPVTFIMVDCNDLKTLNDLYGHKTGDTLLTSIANELSEAFPEENYTIFRTGGDEYLVVCGGMDEREAVARMEEMREKTRQKKINDIPLTFCYGCCMLDEEHYDFDEGIRLSDMAMIEEKARYHAGEGADRRKRGKNMTVT